MRNKHKPIEFNVHISDVQRFKRCRWLWDYASNLRQNLEPTERYLPFFLDSLIHYALEQRYTTRQSVDKSITAFLFDQFGDLPVPGLLCETVKLARQMLDHYCLWQQFSDSQYADSNVEFLTIEHDFITELWSNTRRKINLAGRFDDIVRHKLTGKYYLWGIKTTRSITERVQQLTIDSQSDAYLLAADSVLAQLGINAPCEGILYTLLRKKAPVEPKILQNNQLSQAKNQDTSPEFYGRFAAQHHRGMSTIELQSLYNDFMIYLRTDGTPFFARVLITRTLPERNRAYLDLLSVANEMSKPGIALYPTDDYRCNYCLFRTPCLLRRKGELLAETDYLTAHYKQNER